MAVYLESLEYDKYDALNKNYRNENLFISGIKYIINWVVCSSLVSSQLTWGSFRLKIEITRKTKQKVAKESIGKEEQSYWILIFHDNGFWSPLIYFFFQPGKMRDHFLFFFFENQYLKQEHRHYHLIRYFLVHQTASKKFFIDHD